MFWACGGGCRRDWRFFLSAAHCLAWEIIYFDAMHASKGNSDVLV
jgi:hypothetical protein